MTERLARRDNKIVRLEEKLKRVENGVDDDDDNEDGGVEDTSHTSSNGHDNGGCDTIIID